MHEDKKWNINKTESVFKCKIFEVLKMDSYLPSKKIRNDFYRINLSDWVNVFALTDTGSVLMVKQHRMGRDIVTLEVPAGGIDHEEDPIDAARRELEEETGFTSDDLVLMKKISVNPAIQSNFCYFVLARNCRKVQDTDFDDTEELEHLEMPLDDVLNLVFTEEIDNSLALMSVMFAKEYLKRESI